MLERMRFQLKLERLKKAVGEARASGDKARLADALRELGDLERRPPEYREQANKTYHESAELYRELGRPLDEAWVKRHIGINHEYAERLEEAEKFYDEALALYREHDENDGLDHANAVRYLAVIKNRLGKRSESKALWLEAIERYEVVGIVDGVIEGKLHLANFALDRGDASTAQEWLESARLVSEAAKDPDTHKFIAEVAERLATSE